MPFVLYRALCYLSVKMYKEAVQDCEEALRLDPANIKALYRRAQAHKELKVRAFLMNKKLLVHCKEFLHFVWCVHFAVQDYKACIEDLNSLLKVEPKNTAGQNLLLEVQKKKWACDLDGCLWMWRTLRWPGVHAWSACIHSQKQVFQSISWPV